MATKKNAQTQADEAAAAVQDMMDKVKGHDHIELEDEDGNVYKLGYDRAIIRKMEHDGFDITAAMDGYSGASLVETEDFYKKFMWPAFHKYQPDATEDDFYKLIEGVPDKQEFIQYMTALYMQPILAITANPTQSRMKFRLV